MSAIKLGLLSGALTFLPGASCAQVAKIATDVIVAIAADTCAQVEETDAAAAQDPTVNLICQTVDGKQQVAVRMARVQWMQMRGPTCPTCPAPVAPHDAGKGI